MRGFIVNTNRSEEPTDHLSEEYMLKHGVALVTGEEYFGKINQIEENDVVFLYANEVGIIARGLATGVPWNAEELICDCPARFMSLTQFRTLRSNPLRFSEIPGGAVVIAAVNPIGGELAQQIWDMTSKRLD
jgi:hypothetical protein